MTTEPRKASRKHSVILTGLRLCAKCQQVIRKDERVQVRRNERRAVVERVHVTCPKGMP
jgi:hypothetical protein